MRKILGNANNVACRALLCNDSEMGGYTRACWDPYRKGQINALDRVQNAAAKFAHHRNDSNWEALT
jgi:hypothetical protein